mmetsp:Transcript_30417/g.70745  ORF Transcript_30417/g.70745 Transcript_30417/m.70745 type:complete len:298 (-) Transcript_30417:62-955(-)
MAPSCLLAVSFRMLPSPPLVSASSTRISAVVLSSAALDISSKVLKAWTSSNLSGVSSSPAKTSNAWISICVVSSTPESSSAPWRSSKAFSSLSIFLMELSVSCEVLPFTSVLSRAASKLARSFERRSVSASSRALRSDRPLSIRSRCKGSGGDCTNVSKLSSSAPRDLNFSQTLSRPPQRRLTMSRTSSKCHLSSPASLWSSRISFADESLGPKRRRVALCERPQPLCAASAVSKAKAVRVAKLALGSTVRAAPAPSRPTCHSVRVGELPGRGWPRKLNAGGCAKSAMQTKISAKIR